jgi:hypothetical protein
MAIKREGRNPWVTKMLNEGKPYSGELRDADISSSMKCGVCGGTAYMIPFSENPRCIHCGSERIDGDWT